MWVRAIAEGYYGKLRTPGTADDTFEVKDGEKASWWVKVDGPQGNASTDDKSQGSKASKASGGSHGQTKSASGPAAAASQ